MDIFVHPAPRPASRKARRLDAERVLHVEVPVEPEKKPKPAEPAKPPPARVPPPPTATAAKTSPPSGNAVAALEQSMVQSMIVSGKKDENGLTNAVFYSRHPGMAGKSLAKGSPQVKEWLAIRNEIVRPALSAPVSSAPAAAAPAPPAAGAPSAPGLIARGIDVVTSIAESAYNMVAGWLGSSEEATPAKASPEQKAPAPSGGPEIDTTAGEARFHTKTPTIEGSTLDIAKTRADKGDVLVRRERDGAG